MASGDRFVSAAHESDRLRTALREAGHDVLAVEMEGAAVAQVCLDYGVPFAAVRTISDRADDDAHVRLSALFIQTVASRYADHIVQHLLQNAMKLIAVSALLISASGLFGYYLTGRRLRSLEHDR